MLSTELQSIIAEEEALLARTLAVLAQARRRAQEQGSVPGLQQELEALREDAATAHEADLPHLFHQMDMVRAHIERTRGDSLTEGGAPYFAHLQTEDGAGQKRDYLLGRGSF